MKSLCQKLYYHLSKNKINWEIKIFQFLTIYFDRFRLFNNKMKNVLLIKFLRWKMKDVSAPSEAYHN